MTDYDLLEVTVNASFFLNALRNAPFDCLLISSPELSDCIAVKVAIQSCSKR